MLMKKKRKEELSLRDNKVKELHLPKAVNINETFKYDLTAEPMPHKVLVPKNLLSVTKHKEELNRAYSLQSPNIGAELGSLSATVKSLTQSALLKQSISEYKGDELIRKLILSKDATERIEEEYPSQRESPSEMLMPE